jgi:hypothetical protein
MKESLFFFLFIVLGLTGQTQNNITFEKEDITFEIKDRLFSVNGIYYFHSEARDTFVVMFPFPIDSIYSRPHNLRVGYPDTGEAISYQAANDSSSIVFQTIADRNRPIQIEYQQTLKTKKASYILLSANTWQKALKQADYKLVADTNIIIKYLSLKPDKMIFLYGKNIYLWHKADFIPQTDFNVEF